MCIPQLSLFIEFIRSYEQLKRIYLILAWYTIIYIALKYFYPYPGGISDSGSYVLSAINNKYMGFRPFGYSQFLRYVNMISKSASLLVFIQYLINALSTIIFIFTLKFFFKPSNKKINLLSDLFMITSISVIYSTNTVLSESLLTSLTVSWITIGIWLIFSKKTLSRILLLSLHIIILLIIIRIKYSGLFYLGLEIFIIFATFYREKKYIAILSFLALFILVRMFYNNQVQATKAISGVELFSGFAGWQMTNNAFNVAPHIELDLKKFKKGEVREFATLVDSKKDQIKTTYFPNAGYMWNPKGLMKLYLRYQMRKDKWIYLKSWTYIGGNVYSDFGLHIMVNYPFAYVKHFLFPNFLGSLYPAHDDLYSQTKYRFYDDATKKWFAINSSDKIYARTNIIKWASSYLPAYRLLIWITLFSSLIIFIIKKKNKLLGVNHKKAFWYVVLFVIAYLGFHVYAAPFYMRFVTPIHVMQIAIIYITLNTKRVETRENKILN